MSHTKSKKLLDRYFKEEPVVAAPQKVSAPAPIQQPEAPNMLEVETELKRVAGYVYSVSEKMDEILKKRVDVTAKIVRDKNEKMIEIRITSN
jgi:hypothetical protein